MVSIAEASAAKPDLVTALQSESRERVAEIVLPLYGEIKAMNAINVFEIGDDQGTVLFRGHNPDKFGDDKSGTKAIQVASEGRSIGGLEFGSSGISVRAFVPIMSNDKVIGTLQVGADDSFLDEMNRTLGIRDTDCDYRVGFCGCRFGADPFRNSTS
ncbi:sensor histidine kinase regulating citrate/malate metabolism [Paenibacillus sp. PvR052]|nr:sensor histidine kinase regulating citrate/malate metabolism [Paenibacillus sp. PvP091]MBP1172568.1 sensor histidine kinase regulating citrate/malate metabolism [Paenibacillus sp. PvR098]MBP2438948.1 sensor histidine kinase regulating citrate/malate metabolism [Paenibacillus sp. PvP052]